MQAFLNELSLPKLSSKQDAKYFFDSLVDFYKQAKAFGINEIKVRANFIQYEIASNYSFGNWINDSTTDKDYRTLLISVLSTTPFIDELLAKFEINNKKALEMYYKVEECYGLGLASNFIYDTIAFSCDIQQWTSEGYEIVIKSLETNENDELKLIEYLAYARNISNNIHLDKHIPFIQETIKSKISNGKALWMRKGDLLPNLIFCQKVSDQIGKMDSSHPNFQQILNKLYELQNFIQTWGDSQIRPSDFKSKVTPESTTRLRDFASELNIVCPDGITREFSWHLRYTPGAGRIHFIPLVNDKKIIIGSITNQNTIK